MQEDGVKSIPHEKDGGRHMKENASKHKDKGPASVKITVVPEFLTTCPACGGEIELWSDAKETICIFCQHKVFDKETTVH